MLDFWFETVSNSRRRWVLFWSTRFLCLWCRRQRINTRGSASASCTWHSESCSVRRADWAICQRPAKPRLGPHEYSWREAGSLRSRDAVTSDGTHCWGTALWGEGTRGGDIHGTSQSSPSKRPPWDGQRRRRCCSRRTLHFTCMWEY